MKSLVLKFLKKITGGKKRDDSSDPLSSLIETRKYYKDLLMCTNYIDDYGQWRVKKREIEHTISQIDEEIEELSRWKNNLKP